VATRKQKTKVGIFLVVCFGMIGGGIASLSGMYKVPGTLYYLEFEESILGLYQGGIVEYLGVTVGSVSSITVSPEGVARVDLLLDPQRITLHQGVEAQLALYSFAAGTMAVSLKGSDPNQPVLEPGSKIPTKKSTITAVSGEIENLMVNLNDIATAIRTGMEGMGEGDFTAVVQKVNGLLDDAKVTLADGKTLINETTSTVTKVKDRSDEVIDQFVALSKDMKELAADVKKLVNTSNDKLQEFDMAQTQENLNRVLKNIADVSEKLSDKMNKLDDLTAGALHEADNMEHSMRASLKEVNASFETIQKFLDELRDDPSALVRGKGTRVEGKSE
jgi:ABC-type transporter Mla subunit MlaD